MNRQRLVSFVALALVWSAGAGTAWSQQDPNLARGFSPGEAFDLSAVDSINLLNGNLNMTIPIGSRYPVGDGLGYQFTLVYNINLWEFDEVSQNGQTYVRATPRKTNSGFGWRFGLGGVLYGPGHPDSQGTYRFESEDGSDHAFRATLHRNEPFDPAYAYSRDGSFLRLAPGPGNHKLVESPEGLVREFEPEPFVAHTYRLVEMRDRLGNWVRVKYPGQWEVTDSHGRMHIVTIGGVPGSGGQTRVKSVSLDRSGNSVATWTLNYTSGDVRASCKDNEPRPPGAPPVKRFIVPLLSSVSLPDGSTWAMEAYNTECVGGIKDAPGTLARLRLPVHRGIVEWDYQTYGFLTRTGPGSPVAGIYTHSAGVGKRRLLNPAGGCDYGPVDPACTWTYSWRHLLGGEKSRATVVRTPLGDETVHYFTQKWETDATDWSGWDYGLPFRRGEAFKVGDLFLSQEVYDGTEASGTKLRSTYVLYEHDQLDIHWQESNRRLLAQRTHYEDDTYESAPGSGIFIPHATEQRMADYDGLSHHRVRTLSGDLGGSGTRVETTVYNDGRGSYLVDPRNNTVSGDYRDWPTGQPWVLGTYTTTGASEPGSAVEARACFEASTGRLLRQRFQVSASGPGASDVIVDHTRVRTTVDAKPAIVYQELTYGGDGQTVNAGTDLCNLTLPATPVYRTRHTDFYGTLARTEPLLAGGGTLNLRTLDLAIDADTGLVTSSTDPAGLTTSYEYDLLGRLVWAKPASGGDAWLEIDYDPAAGTTPAQVTVTRRPNGSPSGAALEQSRAIFDPFGRVKRDERQIPGHGWTAVETGFNALGWKTYVTERGRTPGSLPHKTWFLEHDPFGRPGRIELPDYPSDSRHWVRLTYFGARRTTRQVSIGTDLAGGETRYVTTELTDHLGRLFRVIELSGPAGASRNNDYGYDAAGRLTSVKLKDPDLFEQRRTFVYDGRGFLLSETHPENATTVYSDYDARGHAGRKRTGPVQGPFDLAFAYDAAERLTTVREWHPQGLGRLLKEFTYGTGATGTDRSKNKIKTAVRHNHVLHPDNGNQLDVTVTETYTYGGTGGRVSVRTTALSTGQDFTQGWSYDGLGLVAGLTYPTCTHTTSTCGTAAGKRNRTVTFQRQLGTLTGVPGWATSISYHANGMLNQVEHANGVTYAQGLDPHWMRRPGSLSVTHPSNLLALAEDETGPLAVPLAYTYDGAGNVKSWAAEEYRYDAVSRILEGRLGGNQTQAYSYDMYGNIRTITTNRGAGPQTVALGVDRTTNRLSASLYDAAGNLTSRGGFTYGYDALSAMKTTAGGGLDNTYLYTADDERIWSVDASVAPWNETFTLRDLDGTALRIFTTTTGAGNLAWSQDYIHRDGQLLATARVAGASETQHHFHANHLGTPLLITNPTGGTEALHSYFPFGEELNPNADAERMKYTGHERDLNRPGQGDDLDYMHARFFGTLLGRFMSCDPANHAYAPQVPQAWNRYSYVLGNPLKFSDPHGLEVKCHSVTDAETGEGRLICSEIMVVTGRDSSIEVTPWEVGWEWITGTGPESGTRYFADGDRFTEMLKEHRHIQRVAEAACAGSIPPEGRAPYDLSGIEGVPKYLHDYSTLATGGLTGNLAVTYLGSYRLSYTLGGSSVQMTVTNTSSFASGFRPPVLGYTDWWKENVDQPINDLFSSGPMSPTKQLFDLNVPCP